ncbi:MAG: YdcF family protein [Hyphomicrobiaceae bacterium]
MPKWVRYGCGLPLLACVGLALPLFSCLAGVATSVESKLVVGIARKLETRVAASFPNSNNAIDGIIVLGGAPTRIQAALALAERFEGATLILSGPSENEAAIAMINETKVGRLLIDYRPMNTYENALYSGDFVKSRMGERWVMVTSAIHMPRALGVFQAAGVPVIPWPVYDTPKRPKERSASVWHEIGGLAGYWILGRTRHLFPRHIAEAEHPTDLQSKPTTCCTASPSRNADRSS